MRALTAAVFVIALLALWDPAYAQNESSITQSITIEVKPITKIAVSGYPSALIINDAIPGSELTSVRDDNTKYSMVTNLENMKIVASINDKMPAGTKLLINLGSSAGVSAGTVDLSEALNPVDVVTGISRGSDQNQSINYVFAADSNVGDIPLSSRVITLTLTN